jgi:cytochrome b561
LNILQRVAAEATHLGIYLLLFLVPILGWVGVSAYGARDVAGGLALPEIIGKNEELATRILSLHGWAAYALGALVAAHIGAALMHRIILRDGVFQRMWPSRRED